MKRALLDIVCCAGILLVFLVGANLANSEILKGFQIGGYPAPVQQINNSVALAESLGANVVRYQIVDMQNVHQDNYYPWWSQQITNVIASAQFIKARGLNIKLIVDMHTPPFGIVQKKWGEKHLLLTRQGLSVWTNLWLEAISRIESSGAGDVIAAYDLVNEPAAKSTKQLWKRYEKLITELRKVTDKPLIVSVARRDFPEMKNLTPLPFENIWYTFHFYKPFELTHYGFITKYTEGRMLRAAAMMERRGTGKIRRWVKPARVFQKKWNVPIYVGEYGVSAVIPASARALAFKTTLDRFNKWGWHWTVHALNEHPWWQPSGETLEVIRRAM